MRTRRMVVDTGRWSKVTGLYRSDEIDVAQRGCCTLLLHVPCPDAAGAKALGGFVVTVR